MTVETSRKPFILGFILLVLLLGGAVPAFSQATLATFSVGYELQDERSSGGVYASNLLFVGRGGLAISGGAEFVTNYADFIYAEPVIGIGYVFYQGLYFGGLLNVIPRTYHETDGLVVPTLLAGLDFGSFLLEARVSYLHGFVMGIQAWRFSLGIGVNVNNTL